MLEAAHSPRLGSDAGHATHDACLQDLLRWQACTSLAAQFSGLQPTSPDWPSQHR